MKAQGLSGNQVAAVHFCGAVPLIGAGNEGSPNLSPHFGGLDVIGCGHLKPSLGFDLHL